MVRKRLWPPSSSFCSDCRSCVTRPIGTKAENDLTAASSVSIALDSTEISWIGELTDGKWSVPSSWILPTLKASFSSGEETMPVRKKITTTCSAIAIRPKMASRMLLAWNAAVKSASGVMMKSCHFLPKSAGMVARLAT